MRNEFEDLLRDYREPTSDLRPVTVAAVVAIAGLVLLMCATGCARSVIDHAIETPHWEAGYTPTPGDDMAAALVDLTARFEKAGITIGDLSDDDARGGAAHVLLRSIWLNRSYPINAQFEILCHEVGHFFGPLDADEDVQQLFAHLVAVGIAEFYGWDMRRSAGRYLAQFKHVLPAERYMRRDVQYAVEAATGRRSIRWQLP